MNIQLFIVIFIGITVSAIVLRGIYRFFFSEKSSSACGGCKGCEIPKKHAS